MSLGGRLEGGLSGVCFLFPVLCVCRNRSVGRDLRIEGGGFLKKTQVRVR